MFKKRGATQRRVNKEHTVGLAPRWLVRSFWTLATVFTLIVIVLWHPWQDGNKTLTATTTKPPVTSNPTPSTPDDAPKTLDFYHLLRTQQITPVPDHAPETVSNDPDELTTDEPTLGADDPASQVHTGSDRFVLQINSFQTPEEADQLRSNVLLLGVHADIQVTTTAAGEVWYRVFAGPFKSKQAAINTQKTLQNSNIDALVVSQSASQQP